MLEETKAGAEVTPEQVASVEPPKPPEPPKPIRPTIIIEFDSLDSASFKLRVANFDGRLMAGQFAAVATFMDERARFAHQMSFQEELVNSMEQQKIRQSLQEKIKVPGPGVVLPKVSRQQ